MRQAGSAERGWRGAAAGRRWGGGGGGGGGGAGARGGAGGTGGSAGTAAPPVLYAVGDIADCSKTGDTATGLLLDGLVGSIAVLGDIAYPNGSAADFADCFDPPWGRHRPRVRPVPGNHEYQTSGAAAYYDYFGAAAGDPSKGYYSYDLGAWHVVALNSNCSAVSCSAGSTQEQWLRQDLAAHPAACTLAYWHHPRFSSGHNGNATTMSAIWNALHDLGADVVLAGHDHGYQRLGPLDKSGKLAANGMLGQVERAQLGLDAFAVAHDHDRHRVRIDVLRSQRLQLVGGRALDPLDELHRVIERQLVEADFAECGGGAAGGGQALGDAHEQGCARLGDLLRGHRPLPQPAQLGQHLADR